MLTLDSSIFCDFWQWLPSKMANSTTAHQGQSPKVMITQTVIWSVCKISEIHFIIIRIRRMGKVLFSQVYVFPRGGVFSDHWSLIPDPFLGAFPGGGEGVPSSGLIIGTPPSPGLDQDRGTPSPPPFLTFHDSISSRVHVPLCEMIHPALKKILNIPTKLSVNQ